MLLERAIGDLDTSESYRLPEGDWAPLIDAIRRDVETSVACEMIAARFHNALANWIAAVARRAGLRDVAMSGGVFQNAYLVERAASGDKRRHDLVATPDGRAFLMPGGDGTIPVFVLSDASKPALTRDTGTRVPSGRPTSNSLFRTGSPVRSTSAAGESLCDSGVPSG